MLSQLERRVSEVCREIHARLGAHLYVRIEAGASPCMDWREVLIPREAEHWSVEQLTMVLLHEWGHRMIAPVSPLTGKLWARLARSVAGGEERGQLVANLLADAWVDRANLADRYWGGRYRRGMQEALEEATRRVAQKARTGQAHSEGASVPKPTRGDAPRAASVPAFPPVWIAFEERLLADACGEAGSAAPATPTLDALPGDERVRVDALWIACFAGHRTMEQRVQDVAQVLKDVLPEEPEEVLIFISRIHPYLRGIHGARAEPTATELRRARVAGLRGDDLEGLFGAEVLRRMEKQVQRLRMYSRIVPVVDRFLRRQANCAFSGYKPWAMGRPLRELDLLASLQRTPVLVPGTGLVSRRFDHRGLQSARGAGAVVLVVDDSGSTSGETLEREQEAAMAVIAAARAYADPIGCVVFGSSVTASVALTSRYGQVEETICALDSSSGGTVLGPALLEAVRMLGDLPRGALMIMTDAEFYDLADVATILSTLPSAVQVTLFCFSDADRIRQTLAPFMRRNIRVLRAAAEIPFAESALEEVYG